MAQKILKTYKNIFEDLNKNNISYFIFKGLEDLDHNLAGNGGDIDVYIEKKHIEKARKIFLENNLRDVGNLYYKNTFFGVDLESQKAILIDVNTDIHIFRKPYLYYTGKLKIDISQVEVEQNSHNINVLGFSDYTGLMLLMRSSAKKPNHKKIESLQKLLEKGNINFSAFFWKLAENFFQEKASFIIKKFRQNSLNGTNRKILLRYFNTPKISLYEYLMQTGKMLRAIKIKLGFPPYKIRKKGFLVAFTGVDGSGKSSAVEMLYKNNFLKYTGIKKIYFGNNNFWIPGLHFALKRTKNPLGRLILSIVVKIDRQLRIIGAIYYILLGNVVIADRYYYDDMIAKNPYKRKSIKYYFYTIYLKFFKVRMLRKPEISFYMDVSPENAYKRKQDYDFETMKKINLLYSHLMKSRNEVTIIDANKSMKEVHREIGEIVYNYV